MLVQPGTYDVYVWTFEHPLRHLMATNTPFKGYHRNGTTYWIEVDQSLPRDEWVFLGSYEFDDSRIQGVMITDDANGYVAADAVKMVYVGASGSIFLDGNACLPIDSREADWGYRPVE